MGEATEVDHIVPLAVGGDEDDSNLESLCAACHSRKTTRQAQARAAFNKAQKKEAERRNHPGRKDRHDPV